MILFLKHLHARLRLTFLERRERIEHLLEDEARGERVRERRESQSSAAAAA